MVHKGKTDCQPQDVGYNEKILDVLDTHCLELIAKGTICAGSYTLAKDGQIFANRSMGKLSNKKSKDDFTPLCLRPIASTTKAFVGIAMMQLIEQGKIFLNQPVSSVLKEFDTDMHKYITIFQLLTHTSGLKSDPGTYFEPYCEEWDEGWTKENWIKKVLTGPLQYRPGTRWNYCSKGYMLLAEILSRVTGLDFDDYLAENIFKPLGMENTFFYVPDSLKSKVCVVSDWNEWMLKSKKSSEPIPARLAAGGIISTAYDLALFGRMLVAGGEFAGKRIVGRNSVEAATRAQVKEFPTSNWRPHMFDDVYKISWGFGFEVNKFPFLSPGTYDHDGAEGCLLFMDPVEKFVFAGFFPAPDWHGESWVSPLAIAWSGIE
jgi:CubicO group peptidase (beta-lactamase class C family)